MKVLIDNLNEFYSENVRLVKTLMKRESPKEHPELLKWALQMLYFNGDNWIEVCRIDNYMHENQKGSHIHIYKKTHVKKISARILKERFNKVINFGDDKNEL